MLSQRRQQILVVDDEPNLRRVLAAQLQRDGFDVHVAQDGEAGLGLLKEHHVDLVITDLRMPKLDGMGLLEQAQRLEPDLPVIMITAHGTVDNAVQALKLGAFDYITKPFDQLEVRGVVHKALNTRRLSSADARRSSSASAFGLIGSSASIKEVGNLLSRAADTPTTVLIVGETGTGKEAVAHALHNNSSRRERPFIKVNCAAIPFELMDSELFGYEGAAYSGSGYSGFSQSGAAYSGAAYSGSMSSKPGRFELAHGGTLFLDEVSAIPADVQVKLLRAVQESRFERVGGVQTIAVDVRLIVANTTELKQHVAEKRFREDLYYRLNVVPVALPPLRDRKADVAELCEHCVMKFNSRLGKAVSSVDSEALDVLHAYDWPGNVRELENVMEYAVLFCDGARIGKADLPPELSRDRPQAPAGIEDSELGLKAQVKEVTARLERELILKALQQTQGNVTHAARLLKISRKGLQLKMKELDLREREERSDGD